MSTTYILLGSNLEEPAKQLMHARKAIEKQVGSILKASSCYKTPPWGFEHPNAFLNQVIKVETHLSPIATLQGLLSIEQQMGRTRSGNTGYEARNIDLDVLFYDDLVVDHPQLTLPHPRLHERQFTLVPLSEIAPELVHPVLSKTIEELQKSLPAEAIEIMPSDHAS